MTFKLIFKGNDGSTLPQASGLTLQEAKALAKSEAALSLDEINGEYLVVEESPSAKVEHFQIVESEWPDENGNTYFTVTDGCREKGMFASYAEADANMLRIMSSWGSDS